MSNKFLSDAWFNELENLKAQAGSIEVPAALQGLSINVGVKQDGQEIPMSLHNGVLTKGFQADAPTTMHLPADLAMRIFIDNDSSAGMQGFMSGQITVEGDMSRLMSLQMVTPSDSQKDLLAKIKAMTQG